MIFKSLTIKPWLQNAITKNNFVNLTPIQELSYHILNTRHNAILSAPTGTGKTLAYLVPILNNIDLNDLANQCIILLPTKELTWQTYNYFLKFSKFNQQIKIGLLNNEKLKSNYQILVTTITKLSKNLKFGFNYKNLKTIVFDEADMLFDYNFFLEMKNIFFKMNLKQNKIQKIFLSASIKENQVNFFKQFASPIKFIQQTKKIFANSHINHFIVYQKNNTNPWETLKKLITLINPYLCIIFANNKDDVEKIYHWLNGLKKNVTMLHKEINQNLRKQIFFDLSHNKYQFLVSTDLASRGLDIDGVSDVISFGLPQENLWYLHRCGRTGRNNYFGNSYVIYENKISNKLNKLEKKHIKWNYCLLKDNKMIKSTKKIIPHNRNFPISLIKEIKKIYNKKVSKIKPCYKKKIKEKIFKIKQKAKRKYLDQKYQKINQNKNEV